MTINALQDIELLKMSNGRMSVREALLSAHRDGIMFSLNTPGYEFSTQLRFMAGIVAVALKHTKKKSSDLRKTGFEIEAIDQALKDLSPGAFLMDDEMPFMARPALPPKNEKDASRKLGRGANPIKKLSPSMIATEAEDYWDLLIDVPQELEVEEAAFQLMVFHYMSMAGNNKYDGDKCQMGAPALRWVGADYTLTEVSWLDSNLLDTLLPMIPKNWVAGKALPAWADRKGEYSRDEDGQMHPLWKATWSSNAAVAFWEDKKLTGVRTGGIPSEWFVAEMGTTTKSWKGWWDLRNQADPFFLYRGNEKGEMKLQRLDLGRDATDLAVEWAAENKIDTFIDRSNSVTGPGIEARIVFMRHQLAGTASSPNIRASEIFVPDQELWAFDLDEDVRSRVMDDAEVVRNVHRVVTGPFRRRNSNESGTALVLDDLEKRRSDVSAEYWRNVTDSVKRILSYERDLVDQDTQDEDNSGLSKEISDAIYRAAMEAFDEVTSAYSAWQPNKAAYVRSRISRRVWQTLDKANGS